MVGPRQQTWDPARYARNARFVAELGAPLIELLAPRAGERILDLGCGDGALTERLAAAGAEVVGVDSSPEQVAAARARGLAAAVMDGAALGFESAFDAILSNATLHWIKRADATIDGMFRALRPGGRLVAEMGGAGNVETIRRALAAALARRGVEAAAVDPWYFPTPEAYRARLEARGFRVAEMALIPRPTPLPGEMADWLATFAEPFLFAVPAAAWAALVEEVVAALRPTLFRPGEGWVADYVRLRFRAWKPAA